MKFNEYEALSEHLEKEGSSINEFVKKVTGSPLYEADDKEDKLDTKGDTFKRITNPKFARARRKITNNAKDFKKKAERGLIEKWLPKQLEALKSVANLAAAKGKDVKNPEEILQAIGGEIDQMRKMQEKAVAQLEKAIDRMEQNYQKRVDTIVQKSGLKEKSQLKLDNYWVLVSTQVRQLLYKQIMEKRKAIINEIGGNNKELLDLLGKMEDQNHINAKFKGYQNKANEEKKKYDAAGEEGEVEFKVGETYQYTSKKGNTTEVEIIEIRDDGTIVGKNKTNPKGFAIRKDAIGKKLKEAEAEAATA